MNAPVKTRPTVLRLLQAAVNVAWYTGRTIRRYRFLRNVIIALTPPWMLHFIVWFFHDVAGGPEEAGIGLTCLFLSALFGLMVAYAVCAVQLTQDALNFDRKCRRYLKGHGWPDGGTDTGP